LFFTCINNGNQFVNYRESDTHIGEPDGRDSCKLERGDAQRIPAGTIFYLVNPDNKENLRLIKLAMPINEPKFEVLPFLIPN